MKGLEIFEVSRYIVFGPNAVERVGLVLEKLGYLGANVGVLSGKGETAAIADRVISSLDRGDRVSIKIGELARDGVEAVARELAGTSVIIAVGGGRVIDYGKVFAHLLNKPLIVVPTSASHDGIASPYIAYTLQASLGIDKISTAPIAIIADTGVIGSAPPRLLRAGIGDVLAKAVSVKDWELAYRLKGEPYSEYAAKLASSSFEIVSRHIRSLHQPSDEGRVRVLVKALISCGVAMSIAGTSRPCSGSEHLITHFIELHIDGRKALHGELVALSTVLVAYFHGMRWRRILRMVELAGLPRTFRDIGVDRDLAIDAIINAHKLRPDRYTILGEGISRKAAEQALEVTELI